MTFPLADLWTFPLWPTAASTSANATDHLFEFVLLVTASVAFTIFACIFYFAVKYRRRSPDERPRPIEGSFKLETLWSVVPFLIMLVIFGWGAKIYLSASDPPKDALQIYVVGKQWMWKIQHPDGRQEIDELHVPVGVPVQLIITSQDVIHSFFVPAFRIKRDAVPGVYSTEWFKATQTGSFHFFCSQYCGTNHATMTGFVYVMKPADYQRWLAGGGSGESMAAAGGRLYQRLGCVNCHGKICPTLDGLYMKQVPLQDGRIVSANDNYIRESILDPGAKIVAGFPNIMPSFRGQVNEEQMQQLIVYIRSLGAPSTAGPGEGTGAGRGLGSSAGPSLEQQRGAEHIYPPNSNPHTPQAGQSAGIDPEVRR
jgi:cytochrome c oxidase subunit 2